jgi:hypothetical protein
MIHSFIIMLLARLGRYLLRLQLVPQHCAICYATGT